MIRRLLCWLDLHAWRTRRVETLAHFTSAVYLHQACRHCPATRRQTRLGLRTL